MSPVPAAADIAPGQLAPPEAADGSVEDREPAPGVLPDPVATEPMRHPCPFRVHHGRCVADRSHRSGPMVRRWSPADRSGRSPPASRATAEGVPAIPGRDAPDHPSRSPTAGRRWAIPVGASLGVTQIDGDWKLCTGTPTSRLRITDSHRPMSGEHSSVESWPDWHDRVGDAYRIGLRPAGPDRERESGMSGCGRCAMGWHVRSDCRVAAGSRSAG